MNVIEKAIVPALMSIIITLIVYIYTDFKKTTQDQMQETRQLMNAFSAKTMDMDMQNILQHNDLSKRITKCEYKLGIDK
jgi:uncharacterized membrane protein (DUF106 family)